MVQGCAKHQSSIAGFSASCSRSTWLAKLQTFFMKHPPKTSQNEIPKAFQANIADHLASFRHIKLTWLYKAPRDCPTHRSKQGIQVFTVDIFRRKAMPLESLALPKVANVMSCHAPRHAMPYVAINQATCQANPSKQQISP